MVNMNEIFTDIAIELLKIKFTNHAGTSVEFYASCYCYRITFVFVNCNLFFQSLIEFSVIGEYLGESVIILQVAINRLQ